VTTSTAREVDRRRGGAPRKARTVLGAFIVGLATLVASTTVSAHTLRAERYQSDPAGYTHDVIGQETWSKQTEILEALKKPRARVAVRSGHKIGKSNIAACAALWFFDCFTDARVIMTAPTSRQVDKIVWREVRKLHTKAKQPIEGTPGELARTGMKSADFREIVGFTATEAEAVAGVSGENILYIVDEGSGVPRFIFEAIEGNRAGGARLLVLGNPTTNDGEHFDAFHDKKDLYTTFTVSSEESPNVVERRIVIPGLATWDWIEEKKIEWGVDSALYKIRIKGIHVLGEDGKILSVAAITASEDRWEDTPAQGRLFLGIDPAGPAMGGDESGFATRRGKKILAVYALRGLTAAAHLAHALGFLQAEYKPGDPVPVIVIDVDGPVGGEVVGAFRAHLNDQPNAFVLVEVKASNKAQRQPFLFDRTRDELHRNFEQFVKDGGAIPTDAKLAKELHAASWEGLATGKLKATSKDEIRKAIGRSPDRGDAVMLSTWEPSVLDSVDDIEKRRAMQVHSGPQAPMDPYRRGMDPYRGLR
jgi:phage terminase large subunit